MTGLQFVWNMTPCRSAVNDVSEKFTGRNIFHFLDPEDHYKISVTIYQHVRRHISKYFIR